MARRIDHEAAKFRRHARPLVTKGEEADNKLKAQQLSERVAKGHKSPTAHLHGPVRVLSEEERSAWAKAHGFEVKP